MLGPFVFQDNCKETANTIFILRCYAHDVETEMVAWDVEIVGHFYFKLELFK